ncbi:MAG: DUF4826 family protein [Verrucomicrobiota bacterium]
MTEPENAGEEKWIAEERQKVIDYLDFQGCRHAGVEKWPTFHVEPDVALWAVQSIKHTGRVGWWAISGDVPTDYMTSTLGEHPRDALRHFSNEWADVADHMRRGEEHPTLNMGTPDEWPELAEMLQHRADALAHYAEEEGWDD